MEFSQIKRLFPHASYIKNPNSAIEYIINKATKDDFIGIVGTHYWGNAIKEKFNISFEKL